MARPTTKTPAEIAAKLQAAADAAKVRAAKAANAGNPLLVQVETLVNARDKAIIANSRKLKGPNSFENRITAANLRMAWIEAERAEVTAADTLDRQVKDYLQQSLASLNIRLSDGENITQADVDEITQNVPTNPELPALIVATQAAETAWRSFSKNLKGEAVANTTEGA